MPTLILTSDDFKAYRKQNRRHIFYDKAVKNAKEIAVHADGLFPEDLLKSRRPNEPTNVFEYRAQIFVPITKPAFTKVFSSLQKIRRSADWNVDYDSANKDAASDFAGVAKGETLEDYCEKKFPYFTSITNWLFNLELRKCMIDPNAVVLVMPIDFSTQVTEYRKPFPVIFDSENVIDYKEEDFAVLKNPYGATYTNDKGVVKQGESYYFITTERIQRWDQIDAKENFGLKLDYIHELGFLPAQKLGGVYIDQAESQFFYESRISGMLPGFNEAVREYSDLQAAVVLHIYPERWEYTNVECPTCQGKTRIPNSAWYDGCAECGPQYVTCGDCHGTGSYRNRGPYEKIMLKPGNSATGDNTQVPTPPAGFIDKDSDIVKLQDQRVSDHIYRAYSAINFEFLANTPLSQSGTAKEVDKDELNNTVNSFAEDIVKTMDFIYKCVAYYRYKFRYPDKVDEMLPQIAVPVNYDLLGSASAGAALAAAKTASVNPVIINALESEYASKVFYYSPEVKDNLVLELTLDPLPNILPADKVLMLTNKGIEQLTYIVSSNIHAFIQRAIDEDKDFVKKDTEEQKTIIEGFAQEIIDAADAKAKLAKAAFNASGNGVTHLGGTQVDPNGNLVNPDGSPANASGPTNQTNNGQQQL